MKKLLKTLAIGLAVIFTIGCGKDNVEPEVRDEFRLFYNNYQFLMDCYINKGHSTEMYFKSLVPNGKEITNGKTKGYTYLFKFHSIEFKELKDMPLEVSEYGLWYDLFMYIDGEAVDRPDFEIVAETSDYIHYRLVADDLVK